MLTYFTPFSQCFLFLFSFFILTTRVDSAYGLGTIMEVSIVAFLTIKANQMKKITLILSILIFCAVSAVLAVPPNKTLTFDKAAMGPVEFSGKIHEEAGFKCKDCHNKEMFPKMKQGTVEISMKKIYAGELCGKCHDGGRAFAAKKNCKRCHVK